MDAGSGRAPAQRGPTDDATSLINPAGEELRLSLEGPRLWLRIPPDIQGLKERDAVAARRWREQTRAAFSAYLGRGYEVSELVTADGESRYLLAR
jgi:predicted GNAT superfamily acetyltransferase